MCIITTAWCVNDTDTSRGFAIGVRRWELALPPMHPAYRWSSSIEECIWGRHQQEDDRPHRGFVMMCSSTSTKQATIHKKCHCPSSAKSLSSKQKVTHKCSIIMLSYKCNIHMKFKPSEIENQPDMTSVVLIPTQVARFLYIKAVVQENNRFYIQLSWMIDVKWSLQLQHCVALNEHRCPSHHT